MTDESTVPRPSRFHETHARLLARMYDRAGARRWHLSRAAFEESLERSARRQLGPDADTLAATAYIESLHVEDLALAASCIEGQPEAWEYFVETHRQDLRRAARAIAGHDSATDLADSIYADLYGLEERDGQRRSLLLYYHGRSKLTTWLHSILAQRHVDRLREQRRLDPLDDTATAAIDRRQPTAEPPDPGSRRLAQLFARAVQAAVGALDSRQRLRLAWYYAHNLTLKEIGRLLGEHEATVSRNLDRCRRDLRRAVDHALADEHGLSAEEVELCYEYGQQEAWVGLAAIFVAPPPGAVAGTAPLAAAASSAPPQE